MTAKEPGPGSAEPLSAQPAHPPAPSASRWSRLSRGAVLALGAGLGAAAVGACWAGVALARGSEDDASSAGASASPAASTEPTEDVQEPFSTDGTLTIAGLGAGLEPDGDPPPAFVSAGRSLGVWAGEC